MSSFMFLSLGLVLTIQIAGCAKIAHRPLSPEQDETAHGIRYYRAAPYLIVADDGKGGLHWKVLMLPDQSQLFEARPEVVLADVSAKSLTFSKGVMVDTESSGDATAVPVAIIKSAEQVVGSLIAAGGLSVADDVGPKRAGPRPPRLYRIKVSDKEITFLGESDQTELIRVPVASLPS